MSGMKSNTIKAFSKKRIDAWLESITDKELSKAVSKDVILTGGAIASMLLGEKINDYDIYFRTKESALAIAKYYVKQFNQLNPIVVAPGVKAYEPVVTEMTRRNIKGVEEDRVVIYMKSAGVAAEGQATYEYFEGSSEESTQNFIDSLSCDESMFREFEKDPVGKVEEAIAELNDKKKPKFRPVFVSENAITLSDKFQIVVRFFGEPSKLHENYDFAHTMCYYDYGKGELSLPQEALECLLSKSLIYKGSLYPVASVFRTRKFIERGWRITAGQMLKMVWQITELNLSDRNTLREQLMGVDQAYMSQIIAALKDHDGKVDSTYLGKLVDEIFQ